MTPKQKPLHKVKTNLEYCRLVVVLQVEREDVGVHEGGPAVLQHPARVHQHLLLAPRRQHDIFIFMIFLLIFVVSGSLQPRAYLVERNLV